MRQSTRGTIVAVVLALAAAVIAWNGLFGLYVSRGERQYLVEEARFRLGERAAPSLSHIMSDAVREGALHATLGGGVVLLLALAASYAARRTPAMNVDGRASARDVASSRRDQPR